MLLATNMGAKLGLLLALAGLSGWIFIMSTVWAVFGIGLSGRLPSWKALEIDTGNISAITTQSVMAGFPRGWQQLPTDRPEVADATSSADRFLAPSASGGTSRLATPFKNTTDYVTLGVWRRGGDNYLFKIHHHKFFLRHSPSLFFGQAYCFFFCATTGLFFRILALLFFSPTTSFQFLPATSFNFSAHFGFDSSPQSCFFLGPAQGFDFLSRPAKDQWIATLQPHYLQSRVRQFNHQEIDFFLPDFLLPTAFADVVQLHG